MAANGVGWCMLAALHYWQLSPRTPKARKRLTRFAVLADADARQQAQAVRANGESFRGVTMAVDNPRCRVGVMLRLRRSLEREHRLDV
jgi:hypothetical protein